MQKIDVKDKASYHITVDISCDFATNKYIAQIAEVNIKRFIKQEYPTLKLEGDIFDIAVYSLKKSLRLPNCGKISKSDFEQRHLIPITNSTVRDFIVSYTDDVVLQIPFNILLDDHIAVDLPLFAVNISQIDMNMFKQFLEQNEGTKQVQWTVKQNKESFISGRPSGTYTCPVCKLRHDSRGLFAYRKGKNMLINCFKNKDNKNSCELVSVAITTETQLEQYQKIQ